METLLIILVAIFLASEGSKKEAPATPALFVVVPSSDGHVGKVVVTPTGGQPQVLDRAYAAHKIAADGTVTAVTLTEAEVRAAFGPTLAALPGKPATFVLYFLEGKDELTPESRAELDKVFVELKRRPLPDIVVIGHTDTVGNDAFNDRLSLARAQRTRDMMVGMGIPSERVEAAGRGKRELLVPTAENIAEARNRRVEINVR